MKKKLLLSFAGVLLVALLTFLFYVKNHPPLYSDLTSTSPDKEIAEINLGNKGKFGDIKITDIQINGDNDPTESKIHIFEAGEEYVVTTKDALKKKHYYPIGDKVIPKKTSTMPKGDEEKLYGLIVRDNGVIDRITINYKYLGLSYSETFKNN